MTPDTLSLKSTASYIASLQLSSGAVPWFTGGIVDPWDHVEAIMGLTVGGYVDQARHGFDWLVDTQRPDGAWHAVYTDEEAAVDTRAETNFVAYPTTGLWHFYQATGDRGALEQYWPMVERAMNFVLDHQSDEGEVYWAVDTHKGISRDALITGCSSIFKSLQCAAAIATTLQQDPSRWLVAQRRIGEAIRSKPHRFDRTWESKARYSMDWFYPVLAGVYQGSEAAARLQQRWHEFVEEGLGCRCVADRPWITVAETCELIMACIGAGERHKAATLFTNLQRFQLEDGSWWTGYVFPDDVHWPDERPAWTAAAILLAADALFHLTPAHSVFSMQAQAKLQAS